MYHSVVEKSKKKSLNLKNHFQFCFFLSYLDQFMSTMPNRISIPTPKSNCQDTTQCRIWGQSHPRKSRKRRSKWSGICIWVSSTVELNKTSRSKSYCICQSSKTFIARPKFVLCIFASTMEFEWDFLVANPNKNILNQFESHLSQTFEFLRKN